MMVIIIVVVLSLAFLLWRAWRSFLYPVDESEEE